MPPKGLVAARLAAFNQQEQQSEVRRPLSGSSRRNTGDVANAAALIASPQPIVKDASQQPSQAALPGASGVDTASQAPSSGLAPNAATHPPSFLQQQQQSQQTSNPPSAADLPSTTSPAESAVGSAPQSPMQFAPEQQQQQQQPLQQSTSPVEAQPGSSTGPEKPSGGPALMRSSSQRRSDRTVGDSIVQTVTRQNSIAGPDGQPVDLTETISIETSVVDEHGQPVPEEYREEALRMLHASSDAAGLSMQQSAESSASVQSLPPSSAHKNSQDLSAVPHQPASVVPAVQESSAVTSGIPSTPAPGMQQATEPSPGNQTLHDSDPFLHQSEGSSQNQPNIASHEQNLVKPGATEPQLRSDPVVGDSLVQRVTRQDSTADDAGNPVDITETVSIETTVVDEHGNPVGPEQQAMARQLLQESSHAAGQSLKTSPSPADNSDNTSFSRGIDVTRPAAQHSPGPERSGNGPMHQLPRSTPPEARLGLQTATAERPTPSGAPGPHPLEALPGPQIGAALNQRLSGPSGTFPEGHVGSIEPDDAEVFGDLDSPKGSSSMVPAEIGQDEANHASSSSHFLPPSSQQLPDISQAAQADATKDADVFGDFGGARDRAAMAQAPESSPPSQPPFRLHQEHLSNDGAAADHEHQSLDAMPSASPQGHRVQSAAASQFMQNQFAGGPHSGDVSAAQSQITPAQPLSASGEANHHAQGSHPAGGDVDDAFGDFESRPPNLDAPSPAASARPQQDQASNGHAFDAFPQPGTSEAASRQGTNSVTEGDQEQSMKDDSLGAVESVLSDRDPRVTTNAARSHASKGFDAFGAFEEPAAPALLQRPASNEVAASPAQQDGAPGRHDQQSHADAAAGSSIDGTGASTLPQKGGQSPQKAQGSHGGNDEDGFGDFDSTPAQAHLQHAAASSHGMTHTDRSLPVVEEASDHLKPDRSLPDSQHTAMTAAMSHTGGALPHAETNAALQPAESGYISDDEESLGKADALLTQADTIGKATAEQVDLTTSPGQSSAALQPAKSGYVSDDEDGFGDFDSMPAHAESAAAAVLAPIHWPESVQQQPLRSDHQNGEPDEDGFGAFEAFDVASVPASLPQSGHQPAASTVFSKDSSPQVRTFAGPDNGELEQHSPLSSGTQEANAQNQPSVMPVQQSTTAPLPHKAPSGYLPDDEGFGDFDSMPPHEDNTGETPPQQTSRSAPELTSKDTVAAFEDVESKPQLAEALAATGSQQPLTRSVSGQAGNDDDFAAFQDFDGSATSAQKAQEGPMQNDSSMPETLPAGNVHKHRANFKDGTDHQEGPAKHVAPDNSVRDSNPLSDDGFGDFDEAGKDTAASQTKPLNIDEDEFGDFDEQPSAATSAIPGAAPSRIAPAADDNGFADFEGFREPAQASQDARASPPTPPPSIPKATHPATTQATKDQEMLAQSPKALRAAATALLLPFLEAGLASASPVASELQRRLAAPTAVSTHKAGQEAGGSAQHPSFGQLWAAATASLAADSPLRPGVAVDSHLRFVAPRVTSRASEAKAPTWKGSRAEASLLARAGLTDIAAQAEAEAASLATQSSMRRNSSSVADWSRVGRPPVPRQEPSAFAAAVPGGPADQPVAGKDPNSIFANSGAILQADYFSGGGASGGSVQSTSSAPPPKGSSATMAAPAVSTSAAGSAGLYQQSTPPVPTQAPKVPLGPLKPGAAASDVREMAAAASWRTPPGSGISTPSPASPLPVSTAALDGLGRSSPEQAASTAPPPASRPAASSGASGPTQSRPRIPSPPAASEASAAATDPEALKAEIRRQMEASLGFSGSTGSKAKSAAPAAGPSYVFPMPVLTAVPAANDSWEPDFQDAWPEQPMAAPFAVPAAVSAGPAVTLSGAAMSLDPFADMAPLMPEPSWPAADLASGVEALQPGRATGGAIAVVAPNAPAAVPPSPLGGSDDGFGSFNEASTPGSFFPTSAAAASGHQTDPPGLASAKAPAAATASDLPAMGSSAGSAALQTDADWASLAAGLAPSTSAAAAPSGAFDADFDDFLSGRGATSGSQAGAQSASCTASTAAAAGSAASAGSRLPRPSLQLEPEILAGLGRPQSQRASKASSDGTGGRRTSNLPEVPDLSFMLAKTLQRPHTAYDAI
ncbi:hypothetical protein WJX74_000699 [Apatococcus lobatus]|uniref:Uncharacterized protein n=1 Tax=Apatococcus lobatus TaxID=904363 RepID=A0AAW1QHS7_9CHLO